VPDSPTRHLGPDPSSQVQAGSWWPWRSAARVRTGSMRSKSSGSQQDCWAWLNCSAGSS